MSVNRGIGDKVQKGKLLLGLATLGILSIGNAFSQGVPEAAIAKEFRGQATWNEKTELARLFNIFFELAQHPNDITREKVVEATRAELKEPVCFAQDAGAKSCSYDNVNWHVQTFSVSGLRTVSKENESDLGAQLRIQIEKKYVCVPTKSLDKVWRVKPVQGVALVPDSFGNTAPSTELIKTTLYKGINPSAPHVYIEARSVAKCVTDVTLSTIRQPE